MTRNHLLPYIGTAFFRKSSLFDSAITLGKEIGINFDCSNKQNITSYTDERVSKFTGELFAYLCVYILIYGIFVLDGVL